MFSQINCSYCPWTLLRYNSTCLVKSLIWIARTNKKYLKTVNKFGRIFQDFFYSNKDSIPLFLQYWSKAVFWQTLIFITAADWGKNHDMWINVQLHNLHNLDFIGSRTRSKRGVEMATIVPINRAEGVVYVSVNDSLKLQ